MGPAAEPDEKSPGCWSSDCEGQIAVCVAGEQVILKPAESTPLTALALAELAHRAGVPDGVLNIVQGDAKAIGEPSAATLHTSPRGRYPVRRFMATSAAETSIGWHVAILCTLLVCPMGCYES